jgi:hypothetical protein
MDLERRIKQEIAETVEAILSGGLSPILGARRVNAIANKLGESFRGDEDLVAFVVVDSETDALPVDPEVRKLWSPSALQDLDDEINNAEKWAMSVLAPHCEKLVGRFR